MKSSNNCLFSPSHRHLYEKHSLSISKQTYLNRECNRLGMSTLQETFSSMRISDQEVLKLSSFSVSFVISIHFSVFPGYIYIRQHTRKVIHLWPTTVLLWSDIWHGTQTFFLAKACKKKNIPTVSLFQNDSSSCQRLFTKLLFSTNDLRPKVIS